MPIQIVVPAMGESVVEATVGRWLKREGEQVAVGETVVELETDKVNLEVGAEQAGTLVHIERKDGEDVKVGEVLGTLEESGTPSSTLLAPTAAPAPTSTVNATPVAERMAQERGIDLAKVTATGPGGKITKEDVQSFIDQSTPPPPSPMPAPTPVARVSDTQTTMQAAVPAVPKPSPAAAKPAADQGMRAVGAHEERAREERVRMSRRRQTIARRLVEAQHTAAMLTTFNEIDMSAVMDIRKRRKESFTERYSVNLGFMSFFVKATIGALKAFPMLNAEIDGDEFVIKHYYDIGIAVGSEEGLVVPVLRAADQMTFAQIEQAIKALAKKTQDGTLSLDDLRGGTFTITNGGVFGSLLSTPILNNPQVGILGMHKIEERPVALKGQVVVRPMMYVALSYDHRIVDGREAVQFLVRVKELIEDPESLLLEG